MTINERVEQKRAEYESAKVNQGKLWTAMLEAEEHFKKQFQNPWYESKQQEEALEKEMSVLEGIAKEMEAV